MFNVEKLQQKADSGNVEAMYKLGREYALGGGCEIDVDKSLYWLRRAAVSGNRMAKRVIENINSISNGDLKALDQISWEWLYSKYRSLVRIYLLYSRFGVILIVLCVLAFTFGDLIFMIVGFTLHKEIIAFAFALALPLMWLLFPQCMDIIIKRYPIIRESDMIDERPFVDQANRLFILANQFAKDGSLKCGNIVKVLLPSGYEMEFVYVLAGNFIMGSQHEDTDETPHRVGITKGFWISRYALHYRHIEKLDIPCDTLVRGDKNEIVQCNWGEANHIMNVLNNESGGIFRLPTEAEWEYACRAGTTTAYSFGDSLNGDKANCDGTKPYGTDQKRYEHLKLKKYDAYPPNPWGIYDMHGNMSEWCSDFYGEYPAYDVLDPKGPDSGSHRVVRGGRFDSPAKDCRSAARGRSAEEERHAIRLVMSAG